MKPYARTKIPSVLSVSSIISVSYLTFNQTEVSGESHPFWELIYVDKGELQVFVDGAFHYLKAGQCMLYPPNAYHCGPPILGSVGIVSFECESSMVNVCGGQVLNLSREQKELLSRVITTGTEYFRPLPAWAEYKGAVPGEHIKDYELQMLKNQLENLLIDLYRTNKSVPQKPEATNQYNYKKQQFEALTAYMKEHLDTTLSLEELSDVLGVSVSKLKLLFKQQGGSGPIAFFNAMKIAEAKHLISTTTLNMTQISESLGFSSVHYFSKLFKKTVGQTPTEFAKSVCKK